MALQTTYSETMPAYAIGRRGNMEEWNTITRTLEQATALKFGVPVQRGAGEHGIVIFTTGDFLGISEANVVLGNNTPDQYEQYQSVPVCERGVIGVGVGVGGAVAGAPAYYIAATGLWTVTSAGNVAVPGAEFDTTAAAGGVALVRVRRIVPLT